MNVTANINIQQISNGYVISDGYGGQSLDPRGTDRSETRYYATLDDLSADAGRFVKEAIENTGTRMREYEEQMKAERAMWEAQKQSGVLGATGLNIAV